MWWQTLFEATINNLCYYLLLSMDTTYYVVTIKIIAQRLTLYLDYSHNNFFFRRKHKSSGKRDRSVEASSSYSKLSSSDPGFKLGNYRGARNTSGKGQVSPEVKLPRLPVSRGEQREKPVVPADLHTRIGQTICNTTQRYLDSILRQFRIFDRDRERVLPRRQISQILTKAKVFTQSLT